MLQGPYRVISETIVADERRPPSPSRGRQGQRAGLVCRASGSLGTHIGARL
jgi:hypothetical protein